MGFLTGKRALIVGVASNRSIAWGIAEAMARQGCEIALTYQTEKLKKRVDKCAEVCNSSIVIPCDVGTDEGIQRTFTELKQSWDSFDILVHSVAHAPRDALDGNYVQATTRENFASAHEISSYSFTALAKEAMPMLNENGALLTLSYLGAIRAIPNYNIMGVAKASLEANVRYMAVALGEEKGIRVNAISAGPIKTLAASGIKDFGGLLDYAARSSALKRNVTIEEVGNSAAFMCSDLASSRTDYQIQVQLDVEDQLSKRSRESSAPLSSTCCNL